MKRLITVFILIILISGLTACKGTAESDNISAPEVTVKLPEDDSVNGYRTESVISPNSMPQNISGNDVGVSSSTSDKTSYGYCGNKNSKVFHKTECSSVKNMKEKNKYYAERSVLIDKGYSPCNQCKP